MSIPPSRSTTVPPGLVAEQPDLSVMSLGGLPEPSTQDTTVSTSDGVDHPSSPSSPAGPQGRSVPLDSSGSAGGSMIAPLTDAERRRRLTDTSGLDSRSSRHRPQQ